MKHFLLAILLTTLVVVPQIGQAQTTDRALLQQLLLQVQQLQAMLNQLLARQVISPQPPVTTTLPTCVLTSNKNNYSLGEIITYSWTSRNATYASFQQDTSGKDHLLLPGDKLSANGSQKVTANVVGNPTVTLNVSGPRGTGSCTKVVNITYDILYGDDGLESILTFDQANLITSPAKSFIISGSTSKKETLTVAIVGPNYNENTDWNTVSNIIKGGSSYIGVSRTISPANSGWAASFGGVPTEGYYRVLVYDASGNLINSSTLWVTYKG